MAILSILVFLPLLVFLGRNRVRPVALQSQVSNALGQTTLELTMRVEAVNLQMLELRESVNRSLQLLRELITVCLLYTSPSPRD